MECRLSEGVRKRTARKPDIGSRTSQLEDRLNDLVEILRSQQSGSKGSPTPQSSNSIPTVQVQAQAPSDALASAGAYPSPSTGILSSASQVASESGTAGIEDDLSPFEAESILQRFRNDYLTMFPFVWITADTTALELKQLRPFLWLNIRTVCERSASRLCAYGNKVREVLAQRVFVDLERDIDLLLGLMVYLGWATHQTRGRGFQTRFANLANSLVQDLRLDQPFVVNSNNSCWFPNTLPPRAPQTNEQRRAVIGTFVMCSSISNFLRIDVVRWTSHMDVCLEKLAAEPEYFGDELLVAMARVKLIIEDIARVTWKCADYEFSSPPWMYIKPLRDRLAQLKRSLTPELSENKILLSHLQNAEVLVYEMVVFHPTIPIIMPQPTAFPSSIPIPEMRKQPVQPRPSPSSVIKPVDIPRLQALHDCLQAIKRSMSIVLSFEPVQYVGFPFAFMCHMSHSLQTLYRLSVLDEPDWDRAAVRREVDVIAVLNSLADKMSKVAAAAGLKGDATMPCGDMFSKGSNTLRATASIWGSSLPPIEDATSSAADAGPGQFGDAGIAETAEISADTMALMLDLNSDPWLTDLFTSWEGQ
ncbi:hypothetical protein BKA67DRAFT_659807 [Truncatella angustata]|uniref:Uncharacterized protein n=1 Tax=Truncatella angustata TaxID=152316 RepID=A0A9P8UIU3_9PEZI|nr:uncharacterized protein BKA67DRAFT_659807 [Truncatella angustata]KAH6653168.1 hypothetical protein BKA67DRAFT_659807 [Truncatella angustata]